MSADAQVSKPLTFEERLMAKLKDDIGGMITPEELRAVVDKGIEQHLFVRPMIPGRNSWDPVVQGKSTAERLVEEHLKTEIARAVDAWVAANPDKLLAAVNDLVARGVMNVVGQHLINQFQWPLQQAMDQCFAKKQP